MDVEIINLADRNFYAGEVAELMYQEWGIKKGSSLEACIYRTLHCLNSDSVPQTYIAICKNELVGFVSLWNNDLNTRQDLTPWLATLYVKDSFRSMGVGKRLQDCVIESAKKLGYSYLYLITDLCDYYEKNGWEYFCEAPLEDGAVTKIYRYRLK